MVQVSFSSLCLFVLPCFLLLLLLDTRRSSTLLTTKEAATTTVVVVMTVTVKMEDVITNTSKKAPAFETDGMLCLVVRGETLCVCAFETIKLFVSTEKSRRTENRYESVHSK